MLLLKREVIRTQEMELEHGDEYKALLIQAIHKCATRFAEVADSVVLVLLDFLSGDGGYNVLVCVKSIIEQYPNFRATIIRKIIDNLDEITTADALRVALWILGVYSDTVDPSVPICFRYFASSKTQTNNIYHLSYYSSRTSRCCWMHLRPFADCLAILLSSRSRIRIPRRNPRTLPS
jgi:hypothetical protein